MSNQNNSSDICIECKNNVKNRCEHGFCKCCHASSLSWEDCLNGVYTQVLRNIFTNQNKLLLPKALQK